MTEGGRNKGGFQTSLGKEILFTWKLRVKFY
jgi:hypothetical protein